MTLFLDSSALVAVVIEGRGRTTVLEALESDTDWCVSALALGESLALVPRLTDEPVVQQDVEDGVRLMFDRCAVVPVDQLCLDRAAVIAREQPVRMGDAIHLAAADRLQPERFREQVKAEAERIRGNLKLVTFRTDFEFSPGQPVAEDVAAVEAFLAEMEMHSTLRRYQAKHGRAVAAPEPAAPPAEVAKPKPKAKPAADAQQGELF